MSLLDIPNGRNSDYYAKLAVSVKSIRVQTGRNSDVYVKMKIGPVHFQTPRRPFDGQWGDTFDFRINLHAHLFYTLQVDVYEYRMLLASVHLGRAELRLAKLDELAPSSTNFYNLRHRKNCYIHLHELKIRDAELEEDWTGQIELAVEYTPTTEATPMVRFLPLENISTITLNTTPIEPSEDDKQESEVNDTLSVLTDSSRVPIVLPPSPSNRIYDPAITANYSSSTTIGQPEAISLIKRFLGYMMSNEEYIAVKNFLDLISAFGQGIEVGGAALFVGFSLMQRFFKIIPKEFENNVTLRKKDLELPRVMYKYTMATLGWRGLSFFGKGNGIISDSMKSEADLKAVMKFLNMAKSDLLIFELGESRIFRPNFFVAIDHGLSAVILSIRGTMSLSDSITDFACEYIRYRGGMVHSGFFEAARWFMENICHQLIIFAREYQLDNIYICGHSLGGSTSALTTMLLVDTLKKEPQWPQSSKGNPLNIHCYAYGTAPIVSRELCDDYAEFIDTFIYGDDIVPRMSYGSFIDFQILLVYAAEISRTHHVFKKELTIRQTERLSKCRAAIRAQTPQMNAKLYIPGKIHHLIKFKAPEDKSYTVIDTCTADRFVELHVTRKMLAHHMPDKYERALESAYLFLIEEELERLEHPEMTEDHLRETIDTIVSQSPTIDTMDTSDIDDN